MKKLALIMLAFVFLVGCGKYSSDADVTGLPTDMPEDFNITYEDWIAESNKNIFDTYEGYIQKDLVISGTAKADYTPSDEVKAEIYSMVRECSLDKIKKNLTSTELAQGDEITFVEPCTYYKVTFTALGKTYTVSGDYTMRDYVNKNKDAENFWNFIVFIRDIYRSTDEYKSLPEAEGGYC